MEEIRKNDTPTLDQEEPIQVIKAILKPRLKTISAKPLEQQV
jgi:hypothetical protein